METGIGGLGAYLSAILSIVIIDLALSGDNAAVIALAIRELPLHQRKKAAIFGAGGAILLRVIFTIIATFLLMIPYLRAIGGVILLAITWKLIKQDEETREEKISASTRFWRAVGTIIIADLSMAFDNVLAVAGAAHGHPGLVIFGLALSIPILVAGSNWLASLMNRYPIIIYIAAAVLARTALEMIVHDNGLALVHYLGALVGILIPFIAGGIVILWGILEIKRRQRREGGVKGTTGGIR